MRELLDEKLDPSWHPYDPIKGQPTLIKEARRGLRWSTIRQQPKIPGPGLSRSRPRSQLSDEWTKSARAVGAAPIFLANEVDDEEGPMLALNFQYIEKGYVYTNGMEEPSQDFQIGCVCRRCDVPSDCECQSDSEVVNKDGNKAFAYKDSVKTHPLFIRVVS